MVLHNAEEHSHPHHQNSQAKEDDPNNFAVSSSLQISRYEEQIQPSNKNRPALETLHLASSEAVVSQLSYRSNWRLKKADDEPKNNLADSSSLSISRSEVQTQPLNKKRTNLESLHQGSNGSVACPLSDWSRRRLKKAKMRRTVRVREALCPSKKNISVRSFNNHLLKIERNHRWLKSIQQLDPRYQILKYFEEVARQGGALADSLAPPPSIPLLNGFAKAAAFTVWRPTSREAIHKMMRGEATGKGLDVKGKSAKCGKLSGMIPFLQIHKNEDKKKTSWPPVNGRIRIFYKDAELREVAEKVLKSTMSDMHAMYTEANALLFSNSNTNNNATETEKETAMEHLSLKIEDAYISEMNGSGYGLDVPERVFFEAYIKRQDISRIGTEYESGRPSEPAFQDMNCVCVRKYSGSGPRAVIFQTCISEALCPQSLVIAYEENDDVIPVASDFDCFTLGTRGVVYDAPLPDEQVELIKRLVCEIEKILEHPGEKSWTSRWLEVLKDNARKSIRPTVPEYGYGDPKSYDIMKGAVSRFVRNKNGAVRHGAECFNYGFPQELDDHFLVISDTLPGKIPWRYVDSDELKDILCAKIDEGFFFPLNPKWILADKGWKKVYDKMMASENDSIHRSLDSWYPRESGIRDRFEAIYARYPNGFETVGGVVKMEMDGMEAMHLAEDELRRFLVIRRATLKLRAALMFRKSVRLLKAL